MKLVLDLPSAAVGTMVGVALASTPFGARWLLDYDGTSVVTVAVCTAFLGGIAAWLLLFPPAFFRVNHFIPMPRVPTVLPRETKDKAVCEPAMRPLEWLSAHGGADERWKVTSEGVFKAQLLVDRRSTDVARAVAAAIMTASRCPAEPLREIENLAAMVEEAMRASGEPDFASFVSELRYRYDPLSLSGFDDRHSHPATRLLAAVEDARRKGYTVTASSLLWLKGVDRSLYYALSNLGRHTLFVEGAGISAHFAAEKKEGHGIAEPQVAAAIESLEDYLRKHGLIETLAKKERAA